MTLGCGFGRLVSITPLGPHGLCFPFGGGGERFVEKDVSVEVRTPFLVGENEDTGRT